MTDLTRLALDFFKDKKSLLIASIFTKADIDVKSSNLLKKEARLWIDEDDKTPTRELLIVFGDKRWTDPYIEIWTDENQYWVTPLFGSNHQMHSA